MSGGAWEYQQFRIEEEAQRLAATLRLLAEIEHELDWGVSGDTCHKCARIRVGAALEQFFEKQREDASTALAILRDHQQNKCFQCAMR